MIATGASGFVSSSLATQTQSSKRKLIEQERDRLKQDLARQKQIIPLSAELEESQKRQELSLQSLSTLKKVKKNYIQESKTCAKNTLILKN